MLLDLINALAFLTIFFYFVGVVGWLSYIIIDMVYDWITAKLKGDDEQWQD